MEFLSSWSVIPDFPSSWELLMAVLRTKCSNFLPLQTYYYIINMNNSDSVYVTLARLVLNHFINIGTTLPLTPGNEISFFIYHLRNDWNEVNLKTNFTFAGPWVDKKVESYFSEAVKAMIIFIRDETNIIYSYLCRFFEDRCENTFFYKPDCNIICSSSTT